MQHNMLCGIATCVHRHTHTRSVADRWDRDPQAQTYTHIQANTRHEAWSTKHVHIDMCEPLFICSLSLARKRLGLRTKWEWYFAFQWTMTGANDNQNWVCGSIARTLRVCLRAYACVGSRQLAYNCYYTYHSDVHVWFCYCNNIYECCPAWRMTTKSIALHAIIIIIIQLCIIHTYTHTCVWLINHHKWFPLNTSTFATHHNWTQ